MTASVAVLMLLSIFAASAPAQADESDAEALLSLSTEAELAPEPTIVVESGVIAEFSAEQVTVHAEQPFEVLLIELCGGETTRIALDASVTEKTLVAEQSVVAVMVLADAEVRLENPTVACPPSEEGSGEGGSDGDGGSGGGEAAAEGDAVVHVDFPNLTTVKVEAEAEIEALTLELCLVKPLSIDVAAGTKVLTETTDEIIMAAVVEAGSTLRVENAEATCPPAEATVLVEGSTLVKIKAPIELNRVILIFCDDTRAELKLAAEATALVHQAEKTVASVLVAVGASAELQLFKQSPVVCPPAEGDCKGPDAITAYTEGSTNVASWSEVEGADGYRLYRAESGEDLEPIATLAGATNTTFHDSEVEEGTTYEYAATAILDGKETNACDKVEITAVPVLPGMFAGIAATLAGLGAYIFSRRP